MNIVHLCFSNEKIPINRDCRNTKKAVPLQPISKRMVKIAVIGLPQSGKTALSQALQRLAEQSAHAMQFVEVHDLDELHGHTYEVVLQVVDSTRLEESLLFTPHIIDEQQKIIDDAESFFPESRQERNIQPYDCS